MSKRKAEGEIEGGKKRRKTVRRPSPLQEFRKQTLDLKKKLTIQRRECDIKLRQIHRDLGVLKRKK